MPTQNTNSLLQTDITVYEPFALVRSGVFHYIDVSNDETSIFSSTTKLESRPNVVYYTEGSETKAMLDYSNASERDRVYLNILCSDLNNFSGISLSNAVYLDEKSGIMNKSLVSSLLFREYKNNILFTKVLSSVDSGDINKVFYGDYFIDIPVLTTDSSWSNKTAETYSLIINSNPQTTSNFNVFSINPGDLVEIINPNSVNTQQRFEILEYKQLNNKQIIKLKTPAVSETLIGSSTILNFYTKTKVQNLKNLNLDDSIIGCCQDAKTQKTYDNTTEQECYIRTEGNYNHYKSQSCSLVSNSFQNTFIDLTYIVTDKFYITTTETPSAVFDVDFNMSPSNNQIILKVKSSSNLDILQDNVLYLNPNKLYTFEQTTTNNYKKILRFSTTKETLTPYLDGVFGLVNENALKTIHYLRTTNSTPTLYLFSQDEPNTPSTIKLQVSDTV